MFTILFSFLFAFRIDSWPKCLDGQLFSLVTSGVTHCCSRVATYWPKSLSLHVYVYKKLMKIIRLNLYHESVKKMFLSIWNHFNSRELISLFNVEPWTNTIYEIGFQWTFIGVVIHFTINSFSLKVQILFIWFIYHTLTPFSIL